jgi:hypothetical protein
MSETPRRRYVRRPRCANCDTRLQGPWCHACGQHAEGLHRSVKQVVREWVEGLVHFDKRARATLPDLALRPARLTTSYLEGRRAPQVPPLKMFLVVVVLVFAAGSLGDAMRADRKASPIFTYVGLTPATGLGKPGIPFEKMSPAQKAELHGQIASMGGMTGGPTAWLRDRLHLAADNPKAFAKAYGEWSRRLAFLLLPISCALLCLIFFRRRVLVFDHLVFAMHSLSFQGVLLAVTELVAILPHAPALLIMAGSPIHVFAHLRGVYATSIPGTLLRMTVLAVGATLAFTLLVLVAVSGSLADMKPSTPG